MKNKTLTIIGLLAAAIITFSFVYKPAEATKYEFMELTQRNETIFISNSSGCSKKEVESKGSLDASFLMKVTEEYQSLGWEVVNATNSSASPGAIIHSILLKRAK